MKGNDSVFLIKYYTQVETYARNSVRIIFEFVSMTYPALTA